MKRTLLSLLFALCSLSAHCQTQGTDTAAVDSGRRRNIRWDVNAEAAGGTDNRYLTRLFALRTTEHSRLSFFGAANNVNEYAKPDGLSLWQPSNGGSGTSVTRNAGIDYMVDDQRGRYRLEGSTELRHSDTRKDQYSLTESFLESGNIFAQTTSHRYEHNLSLTTSHTLDFYMRHAQIRIKPSVDYVKTNQRQASLRAMYDAPPSELECTVDSLNSPTLSAVKLTQILNQQNQHKQFSGHDLTATLSVQTSFTLPHSIGRLILEANGLLTHNRHHIFQHKTYSYPATGKAEKFQNTYEEQPYNELAGTLRLSFWHALGLAWAMQPYYEFCRRNVGRDRVIMRLDRLDGWNVENKNNFTALPTLGDWHETAFDGSNSVYSTLHNTYHTAGLYFHKDKSATNNWEWDITLPLHVDREGMDYNRPSMIDTSLVRASVYFRPSVQASNVWYVHEPGGRVYARHELNFGYSLHAEAQPISFELAYRDDSNPQSILVTGNKLKDSWAHAFNAAYKWDNADTKQAVAATWKFNFTQNALTMQQVYDRETGVQTISPDNIDGNWDTKADVNYSLPAGRHKRVTFRLGTTVAYVHSVDYSGTTDNVARNVVGTANWSQTVRMDYNPFKDVQLSLRATNAWLHVNGSAVCFTNIKGADFNYGLSVQAVLPGRVEVSTGLTIYGRRGYTDELMNGNDFVWNARISRRFLKNRLAVTAEGFDLLGQMSNVKRVINAQGRTETICNTLRQYAMIHVAYRFGAMPRRSR